MTLYARFLSSLIYKKEMRNHEKTNKKAGLDHFWIDICHI